MTKILTGNMLIAQSGGPTAVINESLIGALAEAKKQPRVQAVYGALHGIKGILEQDLIDLGKESAATLRAVAGTPSSALGTVRKKPTTEDCHKIFRVLKKHNVRFLFYIGGNDSAETAYIIDQEAGHAGYPLCSFHIPKTIDNDLRENDHTPGFGSAAKFVACAFMGDNLDNRALPGVKINIVMGRHAGFLTASSALARVYPDDGPHLIYLPERPFDINRFVDDVQRVHDRLGRCLVAVSEGIADREGGPVAVTDSNEVDSHGNVQLSGTGALGDFLAGVLKSRTSISRVRADTFGYLQRSFPCMRSKVDEREARQVGAAAVREAVSKEVDGSMTIRRLATKAYRVRFQRVSLKSVARDVRHMPSRFISRAGNDVTRAFIEYARPLVGELPVVGRLKGFRVRKSL